MRTTTLLISLAASSVTPLLAKSYLVDLDKLDYKNPKEAKAFKVPEWNRWGADRHGSVRAPLDVEAFIVPVTDEITSRKVLIHLKQDRKIDAVVDLTGERDWKTRSYLRKSFGFTFDPSKHKPVSEKDLKRYRAAYYQIMAERRDLIGSTYFKLKSGGEKKNSNRRWGRSLNNTMSFFSGGHAVAENVALDRELLLAGGSEAKMVNLADIKGVTVKPIDWQKIMPKGDKPELDVLAKWIPEDQHVVFAPNLESLMQLVEVAENDGFAMQTFSSRNPFRKLPTKYMKQMGLDAREMVSLLKLKLPDVGSVAITGGDPFFPTGSDVAVIFEKKSFLLSTAIASFASNAGAKLETGKVGDYAYKSYKTANRSFCSYVMEMEGSLIVANSLAQLEELVAVVEKKSPALAAAEEFHFFRHRYPLKDRDSGKEDAFVYISDACLRRWCGPAMRIGASRRNRAIAAMTELTSKNLIDFGAAYAKQLPENPYSSLIGEVKWLARDGQQSLSSSKFGQMGGMTPLSELEMTEVTESEFKAYEQWREGYEKGWNTVFDPIAIRLNVEAGEKTIDLSVLPLRADSDYDELLELVGKAGLSSKAKMFSDKDAMTFSFAVDPESVGMKELSTSVSQMLPNLKVSPFSWVQGSVTLKVRKGPFWQKVMKAGGLHTISEKDINNIPVYARIESGDNMRMTMFLVGVRAMIESTSPGMLRYTNKKHGEQTYVQIKAKNFGGMSLFYATTEKALLVSMHEDSLKMAIDDEGAVVKLAQVAEQIDMKHLHARLSADGIAMLTKLASGDSLTNRRAYQSRRALPILNEMKRINPKWNAQKAYNAIFGSYVYCPGGKAYQWNEKQMSVTSATFGVTAQGERDAEFKSLMKSYDDLRFGMEFEHGGLRAKVRLIQNSKK